MTKEYHYKKKENGKNDTGAPAWEPTPAQLKVLEDLFKNGAKVKYALFEAGIPSSTYYDYLKAHPDFSEQVEYWQTYPEMIARHSVLKHMVEDGRLAMDYLKSKCKDEFGQRTEITGADGDSIAMPTIQILPVAVKGEDDN